MNSFTKSKQKLVNKNISAQCVVHNNPLLGGHCIIGREVLFEAKIFSPWNFMSALFLGFLDKSMKSKTSSQGRQLKYFGCDSQSAFSNKCFIAKRAEQRYHNISLDIFENVFLFEMSFDTAVWHRCCALRQCYFEDGS